MVKQKPSSCFRVKPLKYTKIQKWSAENNTPAEEQRISVQRIQMKSNSAEIKMNIKTHSPFREAKAQMNQCKGVCVEMNQTVYSKFNFSVVSRMPHCV